MVAYVAWQTVCRWEQLLGANVLAMPALSRTISTPPTRTSCKDRKLTCAKQRACSTTRLIVIGGSCDGALQHAVWLKQVQSIGVCMWGQDDQDAAFAAGNHVRVWGVHDGSRATPSRCVQSAPE